MASMDYLTKRPREANVPYTDLTDEQIVNIKKDPSAFFSCSKEEGGPSQTEVQPREGGRYYRDRYATTIDIPKFSQPWGVIGEKYDRNSKGPRTTSQINAHFKWGPQQAGERTLKHYVAENVNDYMTIDCTRRPPTNLPGQIIFKYGRPAGGYYEQRDPSGKLEPSPTQTFEKSATDLDRSDKTGDDEIWPEYTEYHAKYIMHAETEK